MPDSARSPCCQGEVEHHELVWQVYGPIVLDESGGVEFGEKLDEEPSWDGGDNYYACAQCARHLNLVKGRFVLEMHTDEPRAAEGSMAVPEVR